MGCQASYAGSSRQKLPVRGNNIAEVGLPSCNRVNTIPTGRCTFDASLVKGS